MSAKQTKVNPKEHVVEGSSSRLPLDPPPVYDADWRTRVEQAKKAREDGRKAREGKRAIFSPVHRSLI